jgi:hypothetical protein
MDRRGAVVAGMVAILGLSGSGAVAASAGQEPPPVQCGPATAESRTGDPADEKVQGSTKDESTGAEELAPALAAELGVSLDQTASALKELFAHADERGGIQVDSPSFHAAADSLGVSVQRLREALSRVKQAKDPAKQSLDSAKRAAQPFEDSAAPERGKPPAP